MRRKPLAGMVVPGAITNLRGLFGSSLKLRSVRFTGLVEVLYNSSQSGVAPLALEKERLLARISLRATGTPTIVVVMILVVNCTALSSMPNTSSELLVEF